MAYTLHVGGGSIEAATHYNALQVYNCLVDIIKLSKVNTALGVEESGAVLVANVPCDIKWLSGTERIQFDKTTHFMDAELRCRWNSAITVNNRVRFAGQDFEILDVVNVRNLSKMLVLTLRRVK